MRIFRLRLSIRAKIILLIAGTLGISLAANIYVGTSLMVDDKSSYIYDYSLAEVRSAAEAVESQVQRAASTGRLISALISPAPPPATLELAKKSFEQYAKSSGLQGLLLLSPIDNIHFRVAAELGEHTAELKLMLDSMGWTPAALAKDGIWIAPAGSGGIALATSSHDSSGAPLAALSWVAPDQRTLDASRKDVSLFLFDRVGKILLTTSGTGAQPGVLDPKKVEGIARALVKDGFKSGVKDWRIGTEEYMVAYKRTGTDQMIMVSFIPKSVAFDAAKALALRSLIIGLNIFLLALGLTFVLVRKLTMRLRQMWHATQKVSAGDFTVRVDTRGNIEDEVTGLASSFNTMAGRIEHLMAETAEKARMEKELETAMVFQSRFFPPAGLEHEKIRVSGSFSPASECAGDWWNYATIGDRLIVVIGDVTGHGVSAALVTAAAHGVFSQLLKHLDPSLSSDQIVRLVMERLNETVYGSAGGQSAMTFVASVVDLGTGMMTLSNASHCLPYVFRKNPNAKDVIKQFEPLHDGQIPPLGNYPTIAVQTGSVVLRPGDLILWYTDGLFENRPSDGKKVKKAAWLRQIALLADQESFSAGPICAGIMKDAMEFFGESTANHPDDITVVVASIPATAKFLRLVA